MILVDSSVWIDYFNGTHSPETAYLDYLLGNEPVGIGDLILLEVLQGFQNDADFDQARQLMLSLTIHEMLGTYRALRAAEFYRKLRQQGVTIRKSNDMIIGAYCIDAAVPLLFSDRDFALMVVHLDLLDALPH